ncbi:tripartite tricarboxylate transporter TctB family protein [bacterium LRH843]|nr:tripartite tricarboxylate transporter TctB family protein [bacterium LRH843]
MKNEKIITSIIIFVFATLFLVLTFSFPENRAKDIGPGLLPQFYSVALYLLCIALFIQGLKDMKKAGQASPSESNMLLVFLSMIVSVIYVALIPYLGFYLITLIAMILLLKITRVKSLLTLTLVPIGTTVFILVFFEKLLKVPVPTGMFF